MTETTLHGRSRGDGEMRRVPPSQGTTELARSHWQQHGDVRAWCPDCNEHWKFKRMDTLNSLANAHVRATGDRVQVYRSQWKYVKPRDISDG